MISPDLPSESVQPIDTVVDERRMTKAAKDTIVVLDAGILPHSTNERDHARALLRSAYNIQGGKMYAERIASFHSQEPILDIPPDISLAGQLGFQNPHWESLRKQRIEEQRSGVMTTVADHMMDYVEDAKKNIDALKYLDISIEGLHKSQPLGVLLLDPRPEVQRAVATLTRLYETQEYATQAGAKKSRMNTDLIENVTNDVKERIKEATHELTIGEVKKEIEKALELEAGRLNFWSDQLVGHPDQRAKHAQPDEPDESDEFDRPAIRRRYGVIEIDNTKLRDRVLKRMSAIAAGEFSNEVEQENEK